MRLHSRLKTPGAEPSFSTLVELMDTSRSEEQESISFVLPVSVANTGRGGEDIKRLDLLLMSFLRHFSTSNLKDFWIVSPHDEIDAILEAVRSHTTDSRFRVIPETSICPELAADPDTSASWPRVNKGWYRQQLIKLAACDIVETPFYVTLDADVVCARPFTMSDLVQDGRALCGIETAVDYRALYVPDFASWELRVKEERIGFAERVFGATRPPQYCGQYYSETPTLYATEAVRAMSVRVEHQYGAPWRKALLTQLPWTEQALFFFFLEIEGMVDRFYRRCGANAILRLYDSLWQAPHSYRVKRTLDTWNVERAFSRTGQGYFVVVQSYLENPISEVESRIVPLLLRQDEAAGAGD
jgi:hypothetical protein